MHRIDEAFAAVKRRHFLPKTKRALSFADAPLSIGYGQTNSQPYTVRLLLEWLDPRPGEKVQDIGSGSGWTTALLAHLVGSQGYVHAVEKVPELVQFGRENCQKAGIKNATFYQAGDELGLPDKAPFDRILVSAAADKLPGRLLEQLAAPGRLVVPVQNDVYVVDKNASGRVSKTSHGGFAFVPLR